MLVGFGGQGIPEQENHINLVVGNPGHNLLCTALCAAHEFLDFQPGGFLYKFAGGAGGAEVVTA